MLAAGQEGNGESGACDACSQQQDCWGQKTKCSHSSWVGSMTTPSMPWSPEVTGDASFTARVARVASYRTLWFLIADR